MKVTVLHPEHQKLGAKLVDFAGYEMPLHYGSQIEEHHAVRQKAGMFDVSHMQVIDINGLDAFSFLQKMVANDVGKLKPGKALYTCMLNDSGGIIDDLIVYQLPDFFRVIVNAGTKHTDLAWLKNHAEGLNLMLTPRDDLSILAVQGREARQSVASVLPTQAGEAVLALKPFHFIEQDHRMVARTGYTGEDGVELILPHDSCVKVWRDLLSKGVKPCGLGARDTLRLEAGLNLYGLDMDDQVTPFESNLTWTVALKDNRDFIGRSALEAQLRRGVARQLIGLILEDKGVLRSHQSISTRLGEGETTSGTFSPTLGASIALARIPAGIAVGEKVQVKVRDRLLSARVVKPPFIQLN